MNGRRVVADAERRARLGARHRLHPSQRTDDVVRIADDLVALHSSDPATVYLSVLARMARPALEPLTSALYDDHSLLRHHAMRRTLWVLTPDAMRIAHAACTTALIPNQRKALIALLVESGVAGDTAAAESWLAEARESVLAVLRARGEATARQLGATVPALQAKLHLAVGKRYGSSVAAHTRVLLLLGFEGAIVRGRPTGSWISSEYHWAELESRLPGGLTGPDRDEASTELARRWLCRFGPGTTKDLQWWAGWTMATTRRALGALDAVEVELASGGSGWLLPDDVDPVDGVEPWVALLPGLDPTVMGWKERDWYLPPGHVPALFDRNGNAGPTVWVDGRVVGGWVQRRNGEIAYRLLEDVGNDRVAEIDAAAASLRELLGDMRFTVRFSAPLQAELL